MGSWKLPCPGYSTRMTDLGRRQFLALSGLGAAQTLASCATPGAAPGGLISGPMLGLRPPSGVNNRGADVRSILIGQNDTAIPKLIARQRLAPASHKGGLPDHRGLFHAGSASGLLRALATGFVSPLSRYHLDVDLVAPMLAAAQFLRRVQHEDGTIDLLTTNFHSPPDTGFVTEWVCLASRILRDKARTQPDAREALRGVLTELEGFVVKSRGSARSRWHPHAQPSVGRMHGVGPCQRSASIQKVYR